MRLVLPFRLAPDTLAAPVPGPQHFLVNHPEKREPVQVQRHRYKKQGVLRVAFCRRPSSWAM